MKEWKKRFAALWLPLCLGLLLALAGCGGQTADTAEAPETEETAAAEPADSVLDYSDPSNWSYWAEGEGKKADLFLLCPVVDLGEAGNTNADVTNEDTRASFTGALNMELGIYNDVCTVYAPYYRQVTMPVYDMEPAEADPFFEMAYQDVRAAFLYYMENCDPSRPLILAGFSQGADMSIRLMEEFFGDEQYASRLVADYAIGWRVTEEDVANYPHLKMAQAEDDTGVIIAFNSESEDTTGSLLVPEGVRTYAINPLNWKTDGTPADASLNQGACFTDYSGNIASEIPNLCGGYLDAERGTLKVTGIEKEDYPGVLFPDGVYHLYDYQFFFRNLQENVKVRLAAFQG